MRFSPGTFGAVVLAALLAACSPKSAAPPAESGPYVDYQYLSPAGYLGYHIGMKLADAPKNGGLAVLNGRGCEEGQMIFEKGTFGYFLRFEDGVLTRIADDGARDLITIKGVGIGSTDPEIRFAYPDAIEQPAQSGAPAPAHDLIVWTEKDKSGLRFEIGADNYVKKVFAGGPSILQPLGCP